ncbi:MAG TPA: hypothetical protein VJ743_12095 [Albitalea sp.]|nr:hypothetical protein [Albitalea sp.]
MQVPWFFATTPAPKVIALPRPHSRASWWERLAQRYVAWAERSHERLRGSRALL